MVGGPVVASNPVPAKLNDYVYGGETVDVVNPDNPRVFEFDRSNGM